MLQLSVLVFADHQCSLKPDRMNTTECPLSTFSRPAEAPYPVLIIENKLQTALDRGTKQHLHSSAASDGLLDSCDQKFHHHVSTPDKPYTFALTQFKQESLDDNMKYDELDEESNMKSVMDNKQDTPKSMSNITFTDTKIISPEEMNETVSAKSLKLEETKNILDQGSDETRKMMAGDRASNSSYTIITDKKLSCDTCAKSFKHVHHLISHMQKHIDDETYKCKECGKSFKHYSRLESHSRTHCQVCGKSFSTKDDLAVHKRMHKLHECKDCGKTFNQRGHLKAHSRLHAGGDKWQFVDGKFYIVGTEGSHKSRSFPERSQDHQQISQPQQPSPVQQLQKTQNPQGLYRAEMVRKAFNQSCHLKAHNAMHTDGEKWQFADGKLPIVGMEVSHKSHSFPERSQNHQQMSQSQQPPPVQQLQKTQNPQGMYRAETVGKAFNQSSHLKAHNRMHTDGEKWQSADGKLPIVGMEVSHRTHSFPEKSQHQQQMSQSQQPPPVQQQQNPKEPQRMCRVETLAQSTEYSCDSCEKSFKDVRQLVSHIQTHIDKETYKCKVCGKSFKQNDQLVNHTRIHTGDKTYNCHVCGKSFHRQCDLTVHNRIHSEDKRHECKVCGKAFNHSSHLKAHNRMHTDGEKWQFGDGNLPNVGTEVSHRTHSFPEKSQHHEQMNQPQQSLPAQQLQKTQDPQGMCRAETLAQSTKYSCDSCEKSFKDVCQLVSHIQTHIDEETYKCEVCGKSFKQNCQLVNHTRVQTGDKAYNCHVCGISFHRQCDLTVHSRIHSEDKRHECKVCGKAFNHSSHLKAHNRIHTDGHIAC